MNIVVIEPLGISTEKMAQALVPLKTAGHQVIEYGSRAEDKEELIRRGKEAEVIIVANLPLGREVLEGCPALKMISVAFTGTDHIDISYCKERGIAVSNAAGYSTNAVAELTFGLAISVLRNIPPCDIRTRASSTKDGLVGTELFGKTFGVIGTGSIGRKVIQIARAFGCRVLAYSRTEREDVKEMGAEYRSLEEVVGESDILSLHVPFSDSTKHLLNSQRIGLMKPNAVLINTARGGVIDSQALAAALNAGQIRGAGIDVFETEPPIENSHPLLNSKNTVLTPHVAFATEEALFTRAGIVVDNILLWKEGKQPNIIC